MYLYGDNINDYFHWWRRCPFTSNGIWGLMINHRVICLRFCYDKWQNPKCHYRPDSTRTISFFGLSFLLLVVREYLEQFKGAICKNFSVKQTNFTSCHMYLINSLHHLSTRIADNPNFLMKFSLFTNMITELANSGYLFGVWIRHVDNSYIFQL